MSSWIEKFAGSISEKSRGRKWAQFLAHMTPGPDDSIIDVGVNTIEYSGNDNYLERHYAYPKNITAVGVESDLAEFKQRYPLVTALTADGTKLPFPDSAFDIGYSNAVIEHVGNREQQLAFLRELYRVSKRGYLTMPNRHFPIEIHTRIPLAHLLLPKAGFDWIATTLGKGWAAGDYMSLLTGSELTTLAKEVGITQFELIPNRFLGFPMTYTLVWNKLP
ncbi:MAG: class I SAM-dependent methyltransferase [Undibacterium sp.]